MCCVGDVGREGAVAVAVNVRVRHYRQKLRSNLVHRRFIFNTPCLLCRSLKTCLQAPTTRLATMTDDDEDYRDDDDQPQGRVRPRRRVNESDEEKEEEKVEPQTEHVPDRPDHVEEDGHVPTDGTNYREPRSPFTGCLWNGRMNAFVRIDQENRRRPGGTRPQGYIWVESILGWRRTRLQTEFGRGAPQRE